MTGYTFNLCVVIVVYAPLHSILPLKKTGDFKIIKKYLFTANTVKYLCRKTHYIQSVSVSHIKLDSTVQELNFNSEKVLNITAFNMIQPYIVHT